MNIYNSKPIRRIFLGIKICLIIIICLLCIEIAKGVQFTDQNCIQAVMGEAAGESYQAKLWVACCIRNRGTLVGVYGSNKPDSWYAAQGAKCLADSARAWRESAKHDVTGGCTHFGSVTDDGYFITGCGWKPVATIGQTRFYP